MATTARTVREGDPRLLLAEDRTSLQAGTYSRHMTGFPATFLLPDDPDDPMEIAVDHHAVRMGVVNRNNLARLGPLFEGCGFYMLFRRTVGQQYTVYVGQAARQPVRKRVGQQLERDWETGVLVVRDTTHGFISAEVGWLEGRFVEFFKEAPLSKVENGNQPRDNSLPPHHQQMLEILVPPIAKVLIALGFDPYSSLPLADPAVTGHEELVPSSRQDNRRTGTITSGPIVTAQLPRTTQLIDRGLLRDGERISASFEGRQAEGRLRKGAKVQLAGEPVAEPIGMLTNRLFGKTPNASLNSMEIWFVERDGIQVKLKAIQEHAVADLRANGVKLGKQGRHLSLLREHGIVEDGTILWYVGSRVPDSLGIAMDDPRRRVRLHFRKGIAMCRHPADALDQAEVTASKAWELIRASVDTTFRPSSQACAIGDAYALEPGGDTLADLTARLK